MKARPRKYRQCPACKTILVARLFPAGLVKCSFCGVRNFLEDFRIIQGNTAMATARPYP